MTGRDEPRRTWRYVVKRAVRKLWRAALFLVVGLLVSAIVITRLGVMQSIAMPRIEQALGVPIEAGDMTVSLDLQIILKDVVIRAPGIDGPAGEVVRVGRVEIQPDWGALKDGRPGASRIEFVSPRVRISRDVNDESLNVSAWRRGGTGRFDGLPLLPTVYIDGGVVELGEHDGANYTTIGEAGGSGAIARDRERDPASGQNRYLIWFESPGASAGAADNFSFSGRLGDDGVSLSFKSLEIPGASLARPLPAELREALRSLNIEGSVVPKSLSVLADGSASVTLGLDGVAIDVPTTEEARGEGALRLSDVNGEVRIANDGLRGAISGRAETIRYDVAFDVWGLSEDASFLSRLKAERFRLERDMSVLRFAPDVVIEKIDMFVDPRSDVDAEIWLARGQAPEGAARVATARYATPPRVSDPEATGDVEVIGRVSFSAGSAAYHNFPYRFDRLSGDITFDRERIELVGFRGVSRSGATLSLTGWIAPLGSTAEVVLEISVDGIPIDDELREAMGPETRGAVSHLFSLERYDELVEAGLLRPADEGAELATERDRLVAQREAWVGAPGIAATQLRELDEQIARIDEAFDRRPWLAFGGMARAELKIHRFEGEESVWERSVEVHVPEAGVVPRLAPIPLVGRDLRLHIEDGRVDLTGGSYTTLSGGQVRLSASAPLGEEEEASETAVAGEATVHIAATAVPIDPFILRAASGPSAGAETDAPADLSRLLKESGIRGLLDVEGEIIAPRVGEPLVDVVIRLRDASATLGEETLGTIDASGIDGILVADSDELVVSVDALLTAQTDGGAKSSEATAYATLALEAFGDRAESEGPKAELTRAEVVIRRLDVEMPLERAVASIDPGLAGNFAELRAAHRPTGTMYLSAVRLQDAGSGEEDRNEETALRVRDIERLSFDTPEGRLTLEGRGGGASYTSLGGGEARFDHLRGLLLLDGKNVATAHVDGSLPLEAPRAFSPFRPFSAPSVRMDLDGVELHSPLTRRVLRTRVSEDAADFVDRLDPVGVIDLTLWVERGDDDGAAVASGEGMTLPALLLYGEFEPRQLVLETDRGPVTLDDMSGRVIFDDRGGRIDSVSARAADWAFDAAGRWTLSSESDLTVDITASGAGSAVPTGLMPLAPRAVTDLMDTASFELGAGFGLSDMRVLLEREATTEAMTVHATGEIELEGASFRVGVGVTDFTGVAFFEGWGDDSDESVGGYAVDVRADELRVAGVRMTDASATVTSRDGGGGMLAPDLTATAHGGRVSGAISVSAAEPDEPSAYAVELRASGVSASRLLGGDEAPPEGSAAESVRARGVIGGSLSLNGVTGRPESLVGRGQFSVSGGEVLGMPLLLPLIELSSLQLPVGARLDRADASFYIAGDRLTFEAIEVESGAVSLAGHGILDLPTTELDLRFRSLGTARVPVLTDIVESVRDEIVTVSVTGPLAEPRYAAETLRGTQRIVRAILGDEEGERSGLIRRLGREAGRRDAAGGGRRGDAAPLEPIRDDARGRTERNERP